MHAKFPRYNYDDMVEAQYRLVTDGLGIDHLRLVIGNSMGGMQTWLWGIQHPDFVDALVPMASLPAPMSGRNWMMRRMVIDSVRTDPAWKNGEYTEQPPNLRTATTWFSLATNGGNQGLQAKGPTREQADAYVDERLKNQKVGDANDVMYQWDASRDFDPSADLDKITAHVLVINSADDERNPPELGVLEREMPRIKNGQVYIIPGSPETRGHGTTGSEAKLYAQQLGEFPRIGAEGDRLTAAGSDRRPLSSCARSGPARRARAGPATRCAFQPIRRSDGARRDRCPRPPRTRSPMPARRSR